MICFLYLGWNKHDYRWWGNKKGQRSESRGKCRFEGDDPLDLNNCATPPLIWYVSVKMMAEWKQSQMDETRVWRWKTADIQQRGRVWSSSSRDCKWRTATVVDKRSALHSQCWKSTGFYKEPLIMRESPQSIQVFKTFTVFFNLLWSNVLFYINVNPDHSSKLCHMEGKQLWVWTKNCSRKKLL